MTKSGIEIGKGFFITVNNTCPRSYTNSIRQDILHDINRTKQAAYDIFHPLEEVLAMN